MKTKKKHIDIDDMKAGTALDELVAKNIFKQFWRDPGNSTWFIKDKRQLLYYGPNFSGNTFDAMAALEFYIANYSVLSYKLIEQMEKGPFSCTAEFRLPGEIKEAGDRYVRSWAPTLALAISRALAKAPKK